MPFLTVTKQNQLFEGFYDLATDIQNPGTIFEFALFLQFAAVQMHSAVVDAFNNMVLIP